MVLVISGERCSGSVIPSPPSSYRVAILVVVLHRSRRDDGRRTSLPTRMKVFVPRHTMNGS